MLLLLLLATAPVVWAMLIAIAAAGLKPEPEVTPTPTRPPPPIEEDLFEVELTVPVTDDRVDATLIVKGVDAGGGRHAEFAWGDGTPATIISPVTSPYAVCHFYEKPGTYTVVATVTEGMGFGTSKKVTVSVTVAVGPTPYRIPGEGLECPGSTGTAVR